MVSDSRGRSHPIWIVPVAVAVSAAVLIVVIVMMTGASGSTGGDATQAEDEDVSEFSDAESRDEEDLLAVGPAEAPVVLVMFTDYQCPYCAMWTDETLPAMMEHVEDDELRIEWRDVNVYGPASERSARASYAAALQGAFLDYNDALFENGRTRTEANLSEEKLIDLAESLGLDPEEFSADLKSQETADLIAANEDYAIDLGVTATPVFVMGGQPIIGGQPTRQFEAAFDNALNAAN
ncbi:MAG: DsbA family protein [Brevibacterium aurantiacum]|uniref:Protein-disulfide isomerase n=1 Tax=Brevibacterium aurantiacum TaxID=273384 RepID=A0A2H1KPD5_BREAU|nr:thioredoxin domain-containing protein [Brevibacterium aurantiacum]AOP54435.1 Protein-disulfide isomerase [Brevibacterium aurantiacum]RCT00020.1 protein-disulfide isomerase [Brevibacterium aurantiacum]SMY00524.1 Protein-disulfide isomerase [Brevibacterium aurantiacum]SMY01499.1 Protein-disulfide isomerase [Brevibacterium aurantiacum]